MEVSLEEGAGEDANAVCEPTEGALKTMLVELANALGVAPESEQQDGTSTQEEEEEEEGVEEEASVPSDAQTGKKKPPLSIQSILRKFSPKDAYPIVKLFMEQGYDINEVSAEGMDALNAAAFYDQALVLCLLLSKGFDAESVDHRGNTPLHQAAQQGRIGIIRILLKSNVNVNAVNNDGFTPLHLSVSYDDRDCAQLLLEYGAKVNVKDKENGLAPLHCSTSGVLTRTLLKYKADINIRNVQGWDPLYTASYINDVEKVGILLEHGASVASTTACGYAPLQGAALGGHIEVAVLLLDAKASMACDVVNSPLHLSCHAGHMEFAAFLLARGARQVCPKNCVKCSLMLKRVAAHVPDDQLSCLPSSLRSQELKKRGISPTTPSAGKEDERQNGETGTKKKNKKKKKNKSRRKSVDGDDSAPSFLDEDPDEVHGIAPLPDPEDDFCLGGQDAVANEIEKLKLEFAQREQRKSNKKKKGK